MLRSKRLAVLAFVCGAVASQLPANPAVAAPPAAGLDRSRASLHQAHPAAFGFNLDRTRAELRRLRRDARLPAGSARRGPVPRLRQPGVSDSPSRSLNHSEQFYRVPVPFSAVSRWVHSHPPRGRLSHAIEGSSGSTGAPPSERFFEFDGRDTGAYLNPVLEYSVTPARKGFTFWRVDEMALWLDPRPLTDRPGQNPLRVTRNTGCPGSDRGSSDVRNPGSGLDRHLVPAESPTSVLVCVYSGMGRKHAFRLASARHAGPHRAHVLARAARRISLAHLDGVPRSCPAATGAATVVDFRYARRPDVDLWYARTGCAYVANGHTRSGDAPSRTPLFHLLRRLS